MKKTKEILQTMSEEKKINIEEKEEVVNNEETSETTEEQETPEAAEEQENQENSEEPELSELEQLKDKYLRAVAEFDNYRKRTLKEKTELILNGSENTVKAILPVIDDMERAIENGEKTDDPQVLKEGMELIYQKFLKVLEGLGVKKIDTEGKDFDVDYHEAIAMVPGLGDDKKGKVLDCVITGYMLNGKVIRYAKVAVGQ